ncbi:MAG: hypothetical protein P4N59_22635 [Negativicutes bacterium]|nr:hypothetical protein [Negativicutes bacterium]
MSYKKFFWIVLSICAVCLAIVGFMSVALDPAHVFDAKYAKDIADILLREKNAANVANYDDRRFQRYFIQNNKAGKDIIVFGSSRSLQIDNSIFPGHSFFNHSVFGASLEDHIAIYQLYREQNRLPRTIIIGVDPWILNRTNNQTRWLPLKNEYQDGIRALGLSNYNLIEDLKRQYMSTPT